MGHFEAFPAPYTLDTLVVNGIAFPLQQCRNAPISIAAILAGQLNFLP
jgi:hypothetical protein